jgi:ribulose-phosphate 3-epimerase
MADRRESLPLARPVYYEAHIMVQEPLRLGTHLARIGCRRILAHAESFIDAHAVKEAFSAWRAGGAEEVGLAFLIDTPLSLVGEYASQCDMVLLMSIATLGKQGAPFDERVYDRIREVHSKYPELRIEIDGGVSEKTLPELIRAGASYFSVGSAITKTPNPAAAYSQLLSLTQV